MVLLVRTYDQENFAPATGDLSLGGARVVLPTEPQDTQMEVLLWRDKDGTEARLQGDVLSARRLPKGGVEVRMRFRDGAVEDELALARVLHAVEEEWEPWEQTALAPRVSQ